MTKTDLEYFQQSRLVNQRIWNQVASSEMLELSRFASLEQEYLEYETDTDNVQEESLEIDLPSLQMEQKILKKATRYTDATSPIPLFEPIVDHVSIQEKQTVDVDQIQSKLVQRFFPNTNTEKTVNGVSLKTELIAYRSRNTELELELSKSKQLYAKMKREKEEFERKLRKQVEEKWLMDEMEKLKQEHEAGMKKLKRDKMLWDKQKKLNEMLPTKRERQELELLQQKLMDQQQLSKQKETRMVLTQDRLNKKITDLEKRNQELQQQVKVLEQERFSVLEMKNKLQEPRTLTKSRSADQLQKPSQISSDVKVVKSFPKVHLNPRIVNDASIQQNVICKTASVGDLQRMPFIKRNVPAKTAEPKKTIKADLIKENLDKFQNVNGLKMYTKEVHNQDGSRERFYANGSRLKYTIDHDFVYTQQDGTTHVHFKSGDVQTKYTDGRETTWYNEIQSMETKYPDGIQILEFQNGQIQTTYPDGTVDIEFPDSSRKTRYPDGTTKTFYENGCFEIRKTNGHKTTVYSDKTTVIVEGDTTTTVYNTGIKKIKYPDGSEEKIWPSGKVWFKDGIVTESKVEQFTAQPSIS